MAVAMAGCAWSRGSNRFSQAARPVPGPASVGNANIVGDAGIIPKRHADGRGAFPLRLCGQTPPLSPAAAAFAAYLVGWNALALSGLSGVGRFSRPQARRAVRFYAVATPVLLAASWVLVRVWVTGWPFSPYYVLDLAVNVPGLLMVRLASACVSPATTLEAPEDQGWLGTRFGVTPRELEVVTLAIGGRSNLEIADHLHVSLETVKRHLYNVYKKVGVRNRLQLLRMVQKGGP